MSRQKEAACAAGRIADGLSRFRPDRLHYGPDERPGGEILAGAAFHILGVLLQEALVDGPLDVHIQAQPGLAVDQLHQAAQLGRRLDLALRFAENHPQHARPFSQSLQDPAVVRLQFVAVLIREAGPVQPLGDGRGLGVGRQGLLVGHLQEKEVGELLHIVAVAHAVVSEDIAVVPEPLDDS